MFKKYQFIQLVNAVLFNALPTLPFSEYPTNFEAYIGLWPKSVSVTFMLYFLWNRGFTQAQSLPTMVNRSRVSLNTGVFGYAFEGMFDDTEAFIKL